MKESLAWNHCPLMIRYKKVKRAYLKELMLERWKDGQRVELWNAITIAFDSSADPKKEYWMNRLFSYYNHRFYGLVKCEWLVFLGELNNEAAYGSYKDSKMRYYCCLLRDTAWWLTHQADYEQNAA